VTTLEDRLKDLAQATHQQIEPSPGLLYRIRRSTAPRRPRIPRPIALAAAAVAVIVVVAVVQSRGTNQRVVAPATVTRSLFIAQADQACDQFSAERAQLHVVFATPAGYQAVAAKAIAAAQQGVDQVQSLSANPPPDARQVLDRLSADLGDALRQAQAVRDRAAAGDTVGAASALAAFNTAFDRAGSRLAGYGAAHCQTAQP
jgi:hypothetical protein